VTDGIFGQFDSTVYLGHERLQPLPDPPQPSLVESETILALELAWELPLGSAFNLGAALAAETLTTRREQHDHRDTDSQAVLAELFIEWFTDSPTMSRITVGRQSVSEERGWWWDDTLDAVVIEGESDSLDYQLGVATRNTEISTETIEADPTEDDI